MTVYANFNSFAKAVTCVSTFSLVLLSMKGATRPRSFRNRLRACITLGLPPALPG